MSAGNGLSRRSFLSSAAAVCGGAMVVSSASSARAEAGTATIWELDSDWGYPRGRRGETSCRCGACVGHARNKLFASEADANGLRAHAGCLCVPKPTHISRDVYLALFAGDIRSVDRRDPRIAATLRGKPASPTGHRVEGSHDHKLRPGRPLPGDQRTALAHGSAGAQSASEVAGVAVTSNRGQEAPLHRRDLLSRSAANRVEALARSTAAGSRTGLSDGVEVGLAGAVGAALLGAVLWLRRRAEPEPSAAPPDGSSDSPSDG